MPPTRSFARYRNGEKKHMRWENLTLILGFVAVFVVGIAIGYALKPSVDVRVCDSAQLGPVPPMFDPNNATLKQLVNSPVVGQRRPGFPKRSQPKTVFQPPGRRDGRDFGLSTQETQ